MPLDEGAVVTIGGIDCLVSVDGYSKGGDPQQGPWRQIVYSVPWDDSDDVIDALLGIGNIGVPVGTLVTFPVPHRYPGNPKLCCVSARGEPRGAARSDAKLFASDRCYVDCFYRVPTFDVDGTDPHNGLGGESWPYSKVSIKGYTQTEAIPASILKTKGVNMDPDIPLDRKDSIAIGVSDVIVQLLMRPYLASPFLDTFRNTVNQDAFLGYPVGTVLFNEYDAEPRPDAQGNRYNDHTVRLQTRDYDWNMRAMDNDGVLVWEPLWDGAGYKYAYKDYEPLRKFFAGESFTF